MKLKIWSALSVSLVLQFAAASHGQMGSISTAPPSTMEDFVKALDAAKPGDILQTPFASLDPAVPKLPISVVPSKSPARLIFSDRPEYFRKGDGIASQDTVQASDTPVRIYNYHVPVLTDKKPKRCLTVFENLGDGQATLKFSVYSVPKASGDYNLMAKQAMSDWFNGRGARVVKIPAHATYLAEGSDPIDQPDLLVHGLFEFTTDQPLRITVAQVTATADLAADAATVPTLPKLPMLPYPPSKDLANRGNFPSGDLDGNLAQPYDTANGPAQVIVANGKSDPWIPGVDGISGDATIDKGNYGVAYHLHLKWKSSDGRGVAVLLTTGHKETVSAAVKISAGINPGGVVELPREVVRFHGVPQACVIQTFAAKPGTEGTIELEYTPPGACSLPMPILLVPIK
jgi:hypothetical protein